VARPRGAVATPPKEAPTNGAAPVSKTDELDDESQDIVVPNRSPAPSSTAEVEPPSEGGGETPEQEPPAEEPPAQEPGIAPAPPAPEGEPEPELPPEVQALRDAQSAADKRANDLERALNEERAQRIIDRREFNRTRKRQLATQDPDRYIEESLAEEERAEQAMAQFQQHEGTILNYARQYSQHLYPDLTPDDLRSAEIEMHQLAAQQGRPASAAEIMAMYGEQRVRKATQAMEPLQARIAELEQKVAAYEGRETGEIIEGEEGPEVPAPGGGGTVRITAKMINDNKDDDAWYEANRDAILAFSARQLLRGG
jgi:hypothetical protein